MSSPSKKSDENEVHDIKDLLKCSMSSSYCREKKASTKRGSLIAQVHNTEVKWYVKPYIIRSKKVSKALRQKLVEWIKKNSDMREYPIARDTLLIKDEESLVKRRVLKLLLECSMRQLHNELIASPDDGGLLGARHSDTNDVIISDTMLRYLAPPQLHTMTYYHKMMCACDICNTSKYFQESLNSSRRKKLKSLKIKQIIHVEGGKIN